MQYLSVVLEFSSLKINITWKYQKTQQDLDSFYYMENWSTMKRILICSLGNTFGNTVRYVRSFSPASAFPPVQVD